MAKRGDRLQSKRLRAQAAMQGGRLAEARDLFRAVCKGAPRDGDAWQSLAFIALRLGDQMGAVEALSRLAPLRHGDPKVVPLLAQGLISLGRYREAEGWCERWLEMAPLEPAAHAGVGLVRHRQGRLEEAVDHYRQALEIGGAESNTLENLGAALSQQGRAAEAVEVYRRGVAVAPESGRARTNLLLALHYLPAIDPGTLFLEHAAWGACHGGEGAERPVGNDPDVRGRRKQRADRLEGAERPVGNDPDPGRRLRVGYVSGDFRTHSVAYFIEPLLAGHDRDRFEVVGYSAVPQPDETTACLQGVADRWCDIARRDDTAAAAQIRADRIDILVDLAGHTAGNRLGIFALRPAPVQVTYLGYPDTTGLPAIDCRLVDATTDPPGSERWCTEELVRLSGCFLCYRPPADTPPVGPLPAGDRGYVTFGSFNNLAKVNEAVVAAWAEILRRSPDCRLVVKSAFLADLGTADRLRDGFAAHGVDPRRVTFLGKALTTRDHLDLYRQVDIALDTFPYNGTTTTCEALWQGVPVVTLAGSLHMGRVGMSLLAAAGLEGLVASDLDGYVERAAELAADVAALAKMRATLRDRVATAPLCDEAGFVRRVEDRYRYLWRRWCGGNP